MASSIVLVYSAIAVDTAKGFSLFDWRGESWILSIFRAKRDCTLPRMVLLEACVWIYSHGVSRNLSSIRVDLCHQATDKEEEEDDEEETDGAQAQATVGKDPKVPVHTDKHRRCCHWWRSRIHGRQKFVIAVVMLIFMITLVCAILIWIGMGDNFIDSGTVAEIYSDMLAIVIFLSGGGLAGYGLALYTRMSRLRVGKTSAELQKVAGLAVVSVLCFSIRALFILLGVFKIRSRYTSVVFFLYSFIGEVIPCVVVLWVMRNNPSRLSSTQSRRSVTSVSGYQQALAQEQALLQQWIVPDDMESIIVASSRSRRSKSGRVADSSEEFGSVPLFCGAAGNSYILFSRTPIASTQSAMSKRDAKAFIERITSGKSQCGVRNAPPAKGDRAQWSWDSAEMDETLAVCHITRLSDAERSACAGTLGWDGAREQLDCMVDFARQQLLSTGSAGIVSLASLDKTRR
ncbi:hypothetical protein SELMODRAFT_416368 [Selaginella moellendorffii]|uniref:THH1/TOM1/TOM3 domain-containing protein n=1 Tax=Selaginella moellendorffii TaxID=88036 RepID=D8RZ25_SELML|nr:hypothetical protein SELMODRAFT_416368 [Selaginella moellendorffii]